MTDFNFIQTKTNFPDSLEVLFDFGTSSYSILAGQSNFMTAIWADATASRTSGKIYLTSTGTGAAFSVLDLNSKLLYDNYTIVIKGRANETLSRQDPVDIIV